MDFLNLDHAITPELQNLARGEKKNGSPRCSTAEPGESVENLEMKL